MSVQRTKGFGKLYVTGYCKGVRMGTVYTTVISSLIVGGIIISVFGGSGSGGGTTLGTIAAIIVTLQALSSK